MRRKNLEHGLVRGIYRAVLLRDADAEADGPIGRLLRRITLRENKGETALSEESLGNGYGEFGDAEQIETGSWTPSRLFLGSPGADTKQPLNRAFCGLTELRVQVLKISLYHEDSIKH